MRPFSKQRRKTQRRFKGTNSCILSRNWLGKEHIERVLLTGVWLLTINK